MKKIICCLYIATVIFSNVSAQQEGRKTENFNKNWKFILDSVNDYSKLPANINNWRSLDVPHDWSIELPFDSTSPSGTGGGALRGGMGWYTKEFMVPATDRGRNISIHFDGVYCRSTVWLNGHLLGYRPNGYISFAYNLTPFLNYAAKNIIVVKVNNNQQPNSRWYSGSGIYRKVWLQKTNKIAAIADWGTFITTAQVTNTSAKITIDTKINGSLKSGTDSVNIIIYDATGKILLQKRETGSGDQLSHSFLLKNPRLWGVEDPYLYKAVTQIIVGNKVMDETETSFGIRSFKFDIDKGFILNGKSVKIRGVCNHHDLGSLGTAFNYRAAQRQLEILKTMGCNGIRTSHNPPAPELLDLCDKMGFIVMDEAFDMWEKGKNKTDYHLEFVQWHKKDLEDQVLRDRNHPSVFIWSVGNEVGEQWGDSTDLSAKRIVTDLVNIVKGLDTTRLTVTANNEVNSWSKLLQAGVTDLIGYNYSHKLWDSVFLKWGRKPFIVTESVSALQTRGHYDMPGDSIRVWPVRWDSALKTGNADLTCSAYDNCYAPWGSSHEQTLKAFEKLQHVSGMYIWTGFDYIGEPTPYPWPARSSYFGIVDLAGFPKDVYHLYQSVWTIKPVLHIFPHWNWQAGKTVDVWAYYNNADEVELFLNGRSLGTRKKKGDDMHVFWRVDYTAGTLRAVSRKNGKVVLTKEIKTAGAPAKIILSADRKLIHADGNDLSFITAKIVDAKGILVPDADNLLQFTISGNAAIVATDNGCQTSMESFKTDKHQAFNGLCLAVVQAGEKAGNVTVKATAKGLQSFSVNIVTK
ncbi:MAG: DUF4982 domain-containing protein [Ferruginibacter sp.]|nr:DUF4982 domain-containing protein [Ferruginibacter sp.]